MSKPQSRKVRRGHARAQRPEDFTERSQFLPFHYIPGEESEVSDLDYDSGFDYSFDDDLEEDDTDQPLEDKISNEVTNAYRAQEDQDYYQTESEAGSGMFGRYAGDLRDRVKRIRIPHPRGPQFDKNSLLGSFPITTLGVLLVNGFFLTLFAYFLINLPKFTAWINPPLAPSNFELVKVTTAHTDLAESLDLLNDNINLDRGLKRHVVRLIDLEKNMRGYPEELHNELEKLIEHSIIVVNQYHTFMLDVATTINQTIAQDNRLLNTIKAYEEATASRFSSFSLYESKRYHQQVTDFIKSIPSKFAGAPEGPIRARISRLLKTTRRNVDTALRSGNRLKRMLQQSADDIIAISKEEKSAKEEHLQNAGVAEQALALADNLLARITISYDPVVTNRKLSGLLQTFHSLEDVAKQARDKLAATRTVLNELALIITKVDPVQLLETYPTKQLKDVIVGGKEALEASQEEYGWYHQPTSAWSEWKVPEEFVERLESFIEKSGLKGKFKAWTVDSSGGLKHKLKALTKNKKEDDDKKDKDAEWGSWDL